MTGFFGSYLGPTRGGNPMMPPQPLTPTAILAAGLGDLGLAMQGQPGTNLPQLRYTQQLALHNEAERERLRRKEEREEEELRLKRDKEARELAAKKRLDDAVARHFGLAPSAEMPGTTPAPATLPTTTTPAGEIDWEAVQANPDQWEIFEDNGVPYVRAKGMVAPVPSAAAPPPAGGGRRVNPQSLRSLGDLFFQMNQPEAAAKLYDEARAQEDQQMDWATHRRAEQTHARTMATPIGTESMQFVVDQDTGRNHMLRFNNKEGRAEINVDGEWKDAGNFNLKRAATETRTGPIETSAESRLYGQVETLDAVDDVIDLAMERLSPTDFTLVGEGRAFAQDVQELGSTLTQFISNIREDARRNEAPRGQEFQYEDYFDVGLSTKDYLLNSLAYAMAKARDEDGKISDADFRAARTDIGKKMSSYQDFRAVTDLIKEQSARKRKRLQGRLRRMKDRKGRSSAAVPVEISIPVSQMPGARQLTNGKWAAPDPNNEGNYLVGDN